MLVSKYCFAHPHLDFAYGVKRQFLEALQHEAKAQLWNFTDMCLLRTKDDSITPHPLLQLFTSSEDVKTLKSISGFVSYYAIHNSMTLHTIAEAHDTASTDDADGVLTSELEALRHDRLSRNSNILRIITTEKGLKRSISSSEPLSVTQLIASEALSKLGSSMENISNASDIYSAAAGTTKKFIQDAINPVHFPVNLGATCVSLPFPNSSNNRRDIREKASLHTDVILLGFYTRPSDEQEIGHFVSPWFGDQSGMKPRESCTYTLITLNNLSAYVCKSDFVTALNDLISGLKRANCVMTNATSNSVVSNVIPLSQILAEQGLYTEARAEAALERAERLIHQCLAQQDNGTAAALTKKFFLL